MLHLFLKLNKNESGATAIEYGLIAGLVAVGLITALGLVGTDLAALFGDVSTRLQAIP